MKWNELKDNPRAREVFQKRAEMIRLVREWFWSRTFTETTTPAAIKSPDQEPHLSPVPVIVRTETNAAMALYLQTSPEYSMKKLLGAGWGKIFQICQCWRDGEESGGVHNPEFTMLEWYRAPGQYEEIMDDVENLFKFIGEKMGVKQLSHKNTAVAVDGHWERVCLKDLWKKYTGADLDECLTAEKMTELSRILALPAAPGDDFTDLFYRIFLNRIEPNLGAERPTIVYEYPAQMAALARLCPHDRRYAERFEVYIAGLELANAFGELTDASEQKARFEEEKIARQRLGKSALPIDNELVDALKFIPSAAGIALGMDRMAMLFTGARDISEVIFETVKDQIDS